ncbi:CocE/NonD family hydrolase [Nocardia transvalensis]|uniref:CocE/NonD family hydrolase n=1 Tax=Nocardia transvalensis TaxID=37333 RepID=UPI002B4B5ABE|nr:CocE/NonD family hydrolase [Nocardia transvalensis]
MALTVLLTVAGLLVPSATATTPDGGALGAQWTAAEDGPQQYPNIYIDWDVPITMSDGTVLKANVYRPADANGPIATPTPTIVNLIPYTKLISMIAMTGTSIPVFSDALIKFFRSFDLTGTPFDGITDVTRLAGGGIVRSFAVDPNLIRSGYTQVVVDVRGTGFSQGVFELFGPREQQDTGEVFDWVRRQPWSNGTLGMSGVSYSAINQLQAAQNFPGAVQAFFPVEPSDDTLRDLIAPGGAVGIGFIGPLLVLAINLPKLVPDLMSIVQGRFDWKWLADRLSSPMTFVWEGIQGLLLSSVNDLTPYLRDLVRPDGPLRPGLHADATKVTAPTMVIGGWHDLFARSVPDIYNKIPLPPGRKQLVMGDGYHGTGGFDMRGQNGEPPRIDVLQRAWFDKWLKGIDNGIDTYGPVTLWQQGSGWTTTDRFPRAGVEHRRLYLSAAPSGTGGHSVHDGSLSAAAPDQPARLTVAPGLASVCSRDSAQITMGFSGAIPGCGEDERFHEREGLTFTSAPVAAPTTISGPIAVRLNTVHDATDGYWTVTVNDVAPDGKSTVLTTGQLVSSLRKVDDSRSDRSPNGDYTKPFHSLTLEDLLPVIPGQPTALDIEITPTDAVLHPGHRLRVDVFASNFPKGEPLGPMLFGSQLKPEHLDIDPQAPSYINIPLGGAPGW